MPTTYAHNVFGRTVFHKLTPELKRIVLDNSMAYQIGLHGPDILFYYKPFKSNKVSDMGHRLHAESAAEFFRQSKKQLLEEGDPVLLAYLMGFICHFMLDSSCHSYISYYMEETGAGHDEIETEFDRVLMEADGLNPLKHRPGGFIRVNKKEVEVIAKVLRPITVEEIKMALVSMRFYTGVLVRPTAVGRNGILRLLKILKCYEGMNGRVMRKKKIKRCEEGTKKLQELFDLVVPETVTVIEDFCRTLGDAEYLSGRFERNFG